MKKEYFIEIEKHSSYINNLLNVTQKANQEKLDLFFNDLSAAVSAYGFGVCVHVHFDPVRVTVYNGVEALSHHLTIQNFSVIDKSDDFNPVVLELVESWLRGLE